jgi:hypothetical protein
MRIEDSGRIARQNAPVAQLRIPGEGERDSGVNVKSVPG